MFLNIKDFKHFVRELFVTTTMNGSYGLLQDFNFIYSTQMKGWSDLLV